MLLVFLEFTNQRSYLEGGANDPLALQTPAGHVESLQRRFHQAVWYFFSLAAALHVALAAQ